MGINQLSTILTALLGMLHVAFILYPKIISPWSPSQFWYSQDIHPKKPWLPSGELTFCHGKSPFLMGKFTISMAIFHCYVSSPEGSCIIRWMMLFTLVMPVGLTAVAAQQVAEESWRLASLGSLVAAGTKAWGTPKSCNKMDIMDDHFSIF